MMRTASCGQCKGGPGQEFCSPNGPVPVASSTPIKDALDIFTASLTALGYNVEDMTVSLPYTALSALVLEMLGTSCLNTEGTSFVVPSGGATIYVKGPG